MGCFIWRFVRAVINEFGKKLLIIIIVCFEGEIKHDWQIKIHSWGQKVRGIRQRTWDAWQYLRSSARRTHMGVKVPKNREYPVDHQQGRVIMMKSVEWLAKQAEKEVESEKKPLSPEAFLKLFEEPAEKAEHAD